MKSYQRILALMTAALLALSLTGCLVATKDAETDGSNATEPVSGAATDAPSVNPNASAFDREAVAVELGDLQIKAGEIADVFDQYIGLFSYSGSVGEAQIEQCLDMSLDYILQYYLPMWKAKELGIELSEADEAEIDALAREQVAEERDAVICQFAYYYGITETYPEDPSALTEEETAAVMAAINEELAGVFYEGFTFEQYLDQQLETYRTGARIDRLTQVLKERTLTDDAVDAETVDAWYAETLEKQRETFTELPSEYRTAAENYADGDSYVPVLYVPEGFARIQVLEFYPDGDPDENIERNAAEMTRLEAEYGALVLKGENEERQQEIAARYAELQKENKMLEDAFYAGVIDSVNAADKAVKEGASFEDLMDTYNSHAEGESGKDERLVYLAGPDTRYGDLATEAAKLNPGEISEPVVIDGAYYIIRMVERLPEGETDRASVEDAVTAAATAANRDDAWEAQFDSWLAEANEIAVFHPETYESIGDMYLY